MPGTRRHGKQHVRRDVRENAVVRLLAVRESGEFRSQHVELVAEGVGVPARTVWRWLRTALREGRSTPKARSCLEVTEEDIVDLASHHGSVAAFHRARQRSGPTPSANTWRAAFARALSHGQMVGLARGEQARRDYDTYLTRQPRFRNEAWEGDHTELAIRVVLPDRRVVAPWATLFIDCYCRAILGFAITATPSRESILAAFRSAIMVDAPYGPFGGVPMAIRVDRGRDFLAGAVGAAASSLAIEIRDLPGYTPYLKGTIERANGSVEQLLLIDLPGFLHGARDRAGRLVGGGDPLLSLETFVELFAEFVRWYNTERRHEGLLGRTPLEQWAADATPLHTIPADRLRHLMLVGETRTVTKRGVRLNNRWYNCAELCGHVGTTVEVRHMPHHDGEVEVFAGGEHLGTAQLVERMSRAEMERLIAHRHEDARWLAQVTRAAAKKRRIVYAAMTEPGPAVPVSAPAVSVVAVEQAARDDVAQRRLASRSLASPPRIPERMVRPGRSGS